MNIMNRTELFNEVKSWLEAGKISFASDEEKTFRFRINADNGLLEVHLLCEAEPAMLQACCPVPVRIPKEKVAETGLLLHKINTQLRIGAFEFYVADRVVNFHLSMPIHFNGELSEQFSQTPFPLWNLLD